jgi:CDP-diacylglycerol pyrophosphatase
VIARPDPHRCFWPLFAVVMAACLLATAGSARPTADVSPIEALAARDRDALWEIVDGMCVPNMRHRGNPAPCAQVDLRRGFVVMKDINGRTQFLLIPTLRIRGIEDPQLLQPSALNYWQSAWESRALLEQQVGHRVPREALGLAINSAPGRSQDQLHIHIDCLRPDVAETLRTHGSRIGTNWSSLEVPLVGRSYRAMRVMGEGFGASDPFQLLARDLHARADMEQQTLVVAGYRSARGEPGFVLLSHHTDLSAGDRAHGEDLLDHRCTVLPKKWMPANL